MRTAIIMVVLMLASSPVALAEDQRVEAERYFRAGERAYNAGQYDLAAQAFEEAYQVLAVPAIAFSTAQAYRLQYFIDKEPARLKRAVELYRLYVAQQKTGGRVADAAASLAELSPLLLRLEAEGKMTGTMKKDQTTRLMVVSQVDGARGTIDGEGGALPLTREVKPGEHSITVEADGYFPLTIKANAVDGILLPVEALLKEKPGLLDVMSSAGATVAINGRTVGIAPIKGLEVPAGKHFVTITQRGKKPAARELTIQRGEKATIRADLPSTGQRKAAWYVLGGAGALAVGAGITGVLAISADGKASDLDEKRRTVGITTDELARYEDLRDKRDNRAQMTWILGGAAAATATAGVLMIFFDNQSAESPPMAVAPVAAPGGGGGIVWSGSF